MDQNVSSIFLLLFLHTLFISSPTTSLSIAHHPYDHALNGVPSVPDDTVASAGEASSCISRYHTSLAKWQLVSDLLIAIAYFSIPVELVYFLCKSQVFPFRGVIAQFGCFIVLCGLTHLFTTWSYSNNSEAAKISMTVAKVVTALVSCSTAIILIRVIPEILSVKIREEFFSAKTKELDIEVGKIKVVEETGRHVRMLTSEIRSTLDRHTILNTTIVELSRILNLRNCTIWTPKMNGTIIELSYELEVPPRHTTLPIIEVKNDDIIQAVFRSGGAHIIPRASAIASLSCIESSDVNIAAIRLPLYTTANFRDVPHFEGFVKNESSLFALMVLVRPIGSKPWFPHELELVAAVADQVAVALSHATVVEECIRARDQLIIQNTALQKARQEAELAVVARNEFLAVMNHEMRTPMHAIVALSSLLIESNITIEQKTMVETIIKSGNLLSSLINDVLDFSRLENESLSLDPHPFDLPKLLTEAERLLLPIANAKYLPFAMQLEDGLPQNVTGDSNRILQVILNLVGNAIKFTTEGHVHVRVFMSNHGGFEGKTSNEPSPQLSPREGGILQYRFLHIEVNDTGIGIEQADLPKLFKKFVQADSSITRKFGGTGLGLAISKKIIELMKGNIRIESEGLGKGCTCRLYIQLGLMQETNQVCTPRKARWASMADLKGVKVMVVDDNSINRIVTRRLLETIGCSSTILDSGAKCLQTLAEKGASAFQVVLLDLCMPEMDGFMVAKEILARYGQFERPLIVALTANTDKKTREMCFEVGMDEILMKPINLETLRAELIKLLVRPAPFVVASVAS